MDVYSQLKKSHARKKNSDTSSDDSDYAEFEKKSLGNNIYKHENFHNKFSNQLNLSQMVSNQMKFCQNKDTQNRTYIKDKEDRATVEQVLDPRTRVILVKLLKNQVIREINGCLSTGKEANVYHAVSFDGLTEYAIKIYKTSILIFKDRDRYVEGEVRPKI